MTGRRLGCSGERMMYRLMRRGVQFWWQPLEPKVYTLRQLGDEVAGWEPVEDAPVKSPPVTRSVLRR